MRIFFIEWNKELIDVASKLQTNGHQILYWAGGGDEEIYKDWRQKLKGTVFHRHSDALFAIPPKEFKDIKFEPIGQNFIKNFYETESVLLTMKNFEKQNKSALEKKHLFYTFLEYWYGVIKKLKPDVIIFALWPHTGYNYVIYSLAKFLNIKTIVFEYARIADRLVLINDYTVGSLALREEIKRNKDKQLKIKNLSPDIQAYYNQQKGGEEYKLPPDVKALSDKYVGVNLLISKIKMILESIKDFSIFSKLINYILKRFKSNLKKEYVSLQKKPDFNKKFIYVATHYQPECSTSPLGGMFVDQVQMIKILSSSIPRDWMIYVKEHPYQWLPYGLSFFNYRYKGYYKSIAELKNVNLVPMETSPVELINKSQAVATVTGTSGWEAALNLKPALIFGYAWYRDCPGVFYVNNVDSCKKVINQIKSDSIELIEQDVINYMASLDKISFHGYFEELVKKQSSLSGDKHIDNFFNALIKEIEN